MLDELTYHIHRIADQQWQIECWQNNVLVARKIVDSQHDIGDVCQEMRETYDLITISEVSK